jgi:CheY-like chemotaxis protein
MPVLFVDDDNDLLEILKDHIEKLGVTVHTATNGIEALKILELYKVRLVISDIQMPKMDGIELLKVVRSLDKNIPFFLMSSSPKYNESSVTKQGATGYFSKLNFDITTFIEIVNRFT